jgi:hypothetical protein
MSNTKKKLIVQNQIMAYVHSKGIKCSEKVFKGDKLNEIVKEHLDRAIARARANFRKTVLEKDL